MSRDFSVNYSGIRLDFAFVDKKICLTYCGLEDRKQHRIKKDVRKFYTIVEIDYLGDNKNLHRGLKHYQTGYGETYKYVKHETIANEKGLDLVITTNNDVLEVETHYQLYKDTKAVSSYSVVKNITKENITLTYVSSFQYLGIVPINSNQTYLYQATNSWHEEAQWNKHSLFDLGIFNGNGFTSMKRYCLNNTGSWSTKDYLPMVIIEDKKKKMSSLLEIENNGSWHIELGDFIQEVYLAASGPEHDDNHWKKTITPGETFKTVQASLSFGVDFEETIQEITKARRLMRRKFEDHDHLPIIFNDYMHALWDTQTTELITPLVDIASSIGCETFCIDAGWFAKGSDWWNILGVWKEEKENFPNGGFKAVIDYIKSKGMKAGFWVEIEAVGMNSPILKEMKDGWLFQVDGVNHLNNRRYQLNFANPEVYEYAMGVMDELMSLYEPDYIKIDYNVDAGVGNSFDSDSLGDGLLKHNRAYIKWLNELSDKYPHLTIENCGSGGCRMDYEILKCCPIQSTSDQTNYRKYPYLACNVFTACPPEQAAVWSYPINDYEKIMPTDEVVVMNMANAMLGRIHLASFINKLPQNQLDLIKEGLQCYRSLVDFKKMAVPVYPKGTAKFFDKDVAGGIKHENRIVLGVWNTSGKARTVKVNLAKYDPETVKVLYPTSLPTEFTFDKTTCILTVEFKEAYGGRIFDIITK